MSIVHTQQSTAESGPYRHPISRLNMNNEAKLNNNLITKDDSEESNTTIMLYMA